MKFRRFAVCAGLCTASVFMTLTSAAVTAADDTYKTTVKGKAGQNQLERITDAELPEITGNATYSAYIPLAQTKTVEYFVLDIDGLNNTVYEHLAVTVDKVRIDGEEYEMNSTPAVDIQYEEGSFNGTRIYIANEDSNYPFLPVQTKVNESIEIIFTVKGMPTDGPLFVDKHGAQPETTEPSAEPTLSSSETAVTTSAPKTSGAELVTYESSITSETSASASVSESSSSVSYNALSNNTMTVSRNAGVGLTTTQRTGAPLTGSKGINIAFVGLAVTGLAAIASKIKRKKNK